MRRFTPSPEAIKLILEGQIALSEVEQQGIRIDKPYLDRVLDETAVSIKRLKDALLADPVYKKQWRRRFGDKSNVASPAQIAEVVFRDLGYKSKVKTASGERESASEKALEGIDIPLVKNYLEMQHLIKGRDTFLVGIQRETVQHADGDYWVHPSYHLNTVTTFRSSCSDPNFMNQPSRNPVLAEMVRRCYVPRRGHQIVEIDFGQIEVRIPCAYSFDPNLMAYCFDPKKDMHKEVACQIFKLEPEQVEKSVRHVAKNQKVFPMFYGSYYGQTAPAIWESIDRLNLKLKDSSKTVREHLTEQGITELGECGYDEEPEPGTFTHHIKEIEDHFWKVRFPVHAQWKRDWLDAYRRNGGCQFKNGFIMVGSHKKNDITSYCIQSDAFGCTLWSLPRIVNRLRRYKMRSRVIGEVHDSIQFDVWPDELDIVIDMAVSVMTEEIKQWAIWLNVPLPVEVEVCPVDGSWFEKKVWTRQNGKWVPPEGNK